MKKADENENKIIAKRYAEALMDFDSSELSKESILDQISDIQISLSNSIELQKLICSPVISVNKKKEVLDSIFKENTNKIVLNFLKLLIDKDRFNIFDSIVQEYRNEINRQKGILDIKIISAIELNKNEKAMVKVKMQKLLNREINLAWATDSNIIGGLVFEVNDNIIDCSLNHKLTEIKKEITL